MLAASMVFFASCGDEDETATADARDQWVSTYVGTREYRATATQAQTDVSIDTVFYDVSASVSKDASDTATLIVDYLGSTLHIQCHEGTFSGTGKYKTYEGRFKDDSLVMYVYNTFAGHSEVDCFKGKK